MTASRSRISTRTGLRISPSTMITCLLRANTFVFPLSCGKANNRSSVVNLAGTTCPSSACFRRPASLAICSFAVWGSRRSKAVSVGAKTVKGPIPSKSAANPDDSNAATNCRCSDEARSAAIIGLSLATAAPPTTTGGGSR